MLYLMRLMQVRIFSSIEINATVTRGVIEVSLLEGLGTDASYTKSLPESFKIGFGRPVTKLENLVAWWTFDEGNGSTVTDYMGGYVGNFINNVDGNVTFDNTNSKFGYACDSPRMHGLQQMPTLLPWESEMGIPGQFHFGCTRNSMKAPMGRIEITKRGFMEWGKE